MPQSKENIHRMYREKRQAGLCVSCGCKSKAVDGHSRCAVHKAYQRKLAKEHPHWRKNETRDQRRKYWTNVRKWVIDAYGGKCACCGESGFPFLTIDHIKGEGNKHRKETFGRSNCSHSFYLWLRRNACPPEFQVLCWNCNLAKRAGPDCPHKLMRGKNG